MGACPVYNQFVGETVANTRHAFDLAKEKVDLQQFKVICLFLFHFVATNCVWMSVLMIMI